jgi:hypothetical protein
MMPESGNLVSGKDHGQTTRLSLSDFNRTGWRTVSAPQCGEIEHFRHKNAAAFVSIGLP